MKKMNLKIQKKNLLFVFSICVLLILSSTIKSRGQTTVILKPSNGHDAFVEKVNNCQPGSHFDEYQNTNFGNFKHLNVMTWTFGSVGCGTGSVRSFIKFDDLSTLPAGATILNATLKLYGVLQSDIPGEYGNTQHPQASPGFKSNAIKIGMVQSQWDDQTITWNNKPNVDFSYGITNSGSSTKYDDTLVVDVTAMAQHQYSTGNNYGYGIQLQEESYYRSWFWASSNHPNASRHPELIITYTIDSTTCNPNFSYSFNTETNEFVFTPSSANENFYAWNFGISNHLLNEPSPVAITFPSADNYFVCLQTDTLRNQVCRKCIELCVNSSQIVAGTVINEAPDPEHTQILNLYPNPSSNDFFLEIFTTNPGVGKLVIYDLTGSKISEKSFDFKKGTQTLEHSIAKISKGMYVCTIEIDGMVTSKRFVKQ